MRIHAYAKLNLTLDVTGKRPDGYHTLATLMTRVELWDVVRLEKARGLTFQSDVPLPGDNTLVRAARLYMGNYGGGADICLEKRIPAQAGLGGGSADGAAVLFGLQRLYGAAKLETLFAMARQIGADVPFCLAALYGQEMALCRGIGEKMTPLPPLRGAALIIKGTRGVSTKALFQGLTLPAANRPDTPKAVSAVKRGDLPGLARLMRNALEPSAVALCPEIAHYKERLLQAGALGAAMTGSGSAVFGLFPNRRAAMAAMAAFGDAPFAFCAKI